MPNISRGDRIGGLMSYLAGPGRTNQHTDPHLVAGDPAIMAWHDDTELSHEAALAIGREIGHPRRAFAVDVPGGHVWHCSLSLAATEGQLTDEKWAAIASEFVEAMGFTGGEKAPCRWVAVRHGLSAGGNDHVHIALSLVREDGTKASVWRDRPRAQQVARELERRHGLAVLESREAGRGDRGVSRAELERVSAGVDVEPARVGLARTVRGAAAAAATEDEFVRRLRRGGLLARPRFAAGTSDVVVGYSVAARPARGDRPVWYGGGHLARDLTLPRLRAGWADDPGSASAAVAEWTAAGRNRRPVAPGRELAVPGPELWERYTAEVGALREWLRSVPAADRATWARVAGEVGGALAAWSQAVEATPGPLAAAADSLARSAQLTAHQAAGARRGPSARGAALLCASLAAGGRGVVGQAVLLRQLANTAKALHDAHAADGEATRAAEIARTARLELAAIGASLTSVPLERGRDVPTAVARAVGSVLPADLERGRVYDTRTDARGRGLDR